MILKLMDILCAGEEESDSGWVGRDSTMLSLAIDGNLHAPRRRIAARSSLSVFGSSAGLRPL